MTSGPIPSPANTAMLDMFSIPYNFLYSNLAQNILNQAMLSTYFAALSSAIVFALLILFNA